MLIQQLRNVEVVFRKCWINILKMLNSTSSFIFSGSGVLGRRRRSSGLRQQQAAAASAAAQSSRSGREHQHAAHGRWRMVRKGVGGGRKLGLGRFNGWNSLHDSQTLKDGEEKIFRKMYRISAVRAYANHFEFKERGNARSTIFPFLKKKLSHSMFVRGLQATLFVRGPQFFPFFKKKNCLIACLCVGYRLLYSRLRTSHPSGPDRHTIPTPYPQAPYHGCRLLSSRLLVTLL